MTGARVAVLSLLIAAGLTMLTAAPAAARPAGVSPVAELNIPKAACGVAGVVNKAVGIACGVVSNGGALIKSGKQLVTGHVGGAVSTLLGGGAGSVAATASTALGLAAIGTAVVGGAAVVLHEVATALGGATSTPQLQATWFSATYWRMAEIAALLTLPFLFAATVQAALRSDVALLVRAAFGYLPLAMLSIAIAAPVTTLLLAASDEMCGLISSAASDAAPHVLLRTAIGVGALTVVTGPFLAFLIGLLMIGAAFALWIELLLREAAVYVVVLMLPVAFAALTWPARRIWAIRAVELLVALILSKFAIIAVLSLGGAALGTSVGHASVTGTMAGAVLIMLATLSPWALLRLVPLAEIASGAAGALRGELRSARAAINKAAGYAEGGADWVNATTAAMKRDAQYRMAGRDDPPRAGSGGSDPGGGDPPWADSGGSDLGGGGGPAGSGGGASAEPPPPEPPPRGCSAPEPLPPGASSPEPLPPGASSPEPLPPGASSPEPLPPGASPPRASRPGSSPLESPPPAYDPPPSREVPWNEQSAVELGPDIVNARVHPHPNADER